MNPELLYFSKEEALSLANQVSDKNWLVFYKVSEDGEWTLVTLEKAGPYVHINDHNGFSLGLCHNRCKENFKVCTELSVLL